MSADMQPKTVLEALLFASEVPLTIEQIRRVFDNTLQPSDIRALVQELAQECEQSCRGVRIVEVAGGYRMATAHECGPFLKKLYKERRADKLSKQALETLAIVAYKQPITRQEIQALRSVNIDGVMKTLNERNLVRITGRKQISGRPFVYGTTRLFLEHFGFNSLEDLPKMEDFQVLMKAHVEADAHAQPDAPQSEASAIQPEIPDESNTPA
jgi:segregation and condensation protein B